MIICDGCGKEATHFFKLDPDLAWSVCERCHYKYGHKDECSTGNLAQRICV